MTNKIERNILLTWLFLAVGWPLLIIAVYKVVNCPINWWVVFAPHLISFGVGIVHILLDQKNIFK
ncbi:MAG: hypothetical protein IPO16_14980 [Saprospiraceae bacterium]|nr:hypothetical protein [Saprospiraceae bacterium]